MRINHVTAFDVPFVRLSVGAAVEGLARNLWLPCRLYSEPDWRARKFDPKHKGEACVWIVEAAYLESARLSVGELKLHFPRAKVVVLGSDTFFHIHQGSRQFQGLEEVDLYLDLMEECAEAYAHMVPTDTWAWSSSQYLNDYLTDFAGKNPALPFEERPFWFISVLAAHSINRAGSYRKRLFDTLNYLDRPITRGRSLGYNDPDMDRLYWSYLDSRFTLATSSHDNGMRSAKGFRDSVGVLLGRLVLADNFPDTMRKYPDFVFYDYDDLDSIIDLADYYAARPGEYAAKLAAQQEWARAHTIERQLETLLKKHDILPEVAP